MLTVANRTADILVKMLNLADAWGWCPSGSGPDSHPYSLAYAGGAIWYNESGVRPDALVRFDPATETFQSWVIPSGNVYGGIVRHMRRTRDTVCPVTESSRNSGALGSAGLVDGPRLPTLRIKNATSDSSDRGALPHRSFPPREPRHRRSPGCRIVHPPCMHSS